MGDAPSLWLNNLPTGSITSWADLSQAFTSNFQVTYNRPGNAFNLGRVTMKANERLQDYTNQFFENRSTCVSVRDDQVVDSYKKGLRTAKSLRRSTSPVPRRSRHSWRSSTNSSTPRKLWSTSVGDSHKGPLNNQGETRLKPAKNANHGSTRKLKARTRRDHCPGAPRGPPGRHGGTPLE
jgi:hypothetical protein